VSVETFTALAGIMLYGVAATTIGYAIGIAVSKRDLFEHARRATEREIALQTEVHRLSTQLIAAGRVAQDPRPEVTR
jgi:hypothetical protein